MDKKTKEVVGIFSERDYTRKVALKKKTSSKTKVKDIMTEKLYYVSPERTAEECLEVMNSHGIRHLPVIESDGSVVGLLSVLDVVNSVLKEKKKVISNLEAYVSETWPF